MFDLQALGFQADATRVFTMIVCRELSARTYPQIGVPDPHHPMSRMHRERSSCLKPVAVLRYLSFLQKLATQLDVCCSTRASNPSAAAWAMRHRMVRVRHADLGISAGAQLTAHDHREYASGVGLEP